MPLRVNPFNEPYATETMTPENFVQLFSPLLVRDALALFQPGNNLAQNFIEPWVTLTINRSGRPHEFDNGWQNNNNLVAATPTTPARKDAGDFFQVASDALREML